jgi:hypothetical protein
VSAGMWTTREACVPESKSSDHMNALVTCRRLGPIGGVTDTFKGVSGMNGCRLSVCVFDFHDCCPGACHTTNPKTHLS